ncbi:MAG: TonB-dependent receptor [Pedobacter sp.]|nr:TonB-dependent receptor [Pedobacter sp.]
MNIEVFSHLKEYFSNLKARPLMATVILFCFLNNVMATTVSYSQPEQAINLKLTAVTIPAGLSVLESKTGCVINYNQSLFKNNSNISIDVKGMSLQQVLTRMLANTRVGFKFEDSKTILLYRLPDPVKPGKISGRVLDDKGETLPGASIRVVETGAGTQTGVDGSYILSIAPGTYTLEVSYISYQSKRITGVVVADGKNTPLDVSLKQDSKGLKEVMVTANYKKASVEGLLVRQKNAAELSNGISAEQLARTPDKNIGESLKRISGVSTMDNKFVLVRGIGERYNSATLDGTVLPSTEAQTRNFSFDLIPSNLVDNVVVSKTVTPDMNASFGGGLIQINTKDIPNENFMSFTIGSSYNDQSTGKEFLSHKRGKYDYLGFDDGRRDYPEGLVKTNINTFPNTELTPAEYQKKVDDQSRRFTNDNFTIYKTKTVPSQNYQFTIGRLITIDTTSQNKFGFTGSLSYRNTQNINEFDHQTRTAWRDDYNNSGSTYGFNTTWGALLNAGLQLGTNRFSIRNTYTHMYDNALTRTIGYDDAGDGPNAAPNVIPDRIEEVDDPTFTDLLQNKITGQHQAGKIKIEWNVARTSIDRNEKDMGIATQRPVLVNGNYQYFYYGGSVSEPRVVPMSRHNYNTSEEHYSWSAAATIPFKVAGINNSLKTGYFGIRKKGSFGWQIADFSQSALLTDSLRYLPLADMLKPEYIGATGFSYHVTNGGVDKYEGKSESHAGYLMFDSRLIEKLRLVWGVRGEYFHYTEISNPSNEKISVYEQKTDQKWQWLPSANLTYSPISAINLRAAYSSSVVRPELMDNSQFWRYNAFFGAQVGNAGLSSTRINSFDVKTEWFPGLGEILSVGGFYKKFDSPVELTFNTLSGNIAYNLMNADYADVYGLEFELRKNLSFISDAQILSNFSLYGNLTLQKSEVKGTYVSENPDPDATGLYYVSSTQKRSMYGQSPYLINAGLQYNDSHFGFNVMYNRSGFKTYVVSELPSDIEYEKSREQIDAQISYKFLKGKMEIKVNAGNLLNRASLFYRNTASYEKNPDFDLGSSDRSDALRLKTGFTNKYEEGDQVMFRQKFGRTYSTSISYNF